MALAFLRHFEDLVGAQFDSISEADLGRLVAGKVAEAEDLDFKGELYGTSDSQKAELAKDIAALANRRGGLLILGIEDEEGIAARLSPVPLSEAEVLRMRQILADRVAPNLQIEIRRVEAKQKADGYYLIAVPPSADRPHAVRRDVDLRYPSRYGSITIFLSESQVADAYRDRFAASRATAERLEDVEKDGAVALSAVAEPWLMVAVAPIATSRSELSLRLVGQYRQWMEEFTKTMPPYVGFEAPPLRVGYRRVVGNTWPERGTGLATGTYLQLHTDGCGFAAVPLRSLTDPEETYLVNESGVVLGTLSLLWMLARHALDHAGAVGDAAVVTRVAAARKPALLGRLVPYPRQEGTGPLNAAQQSAHTFVVSTLASNPQDLAIATRTLIGDLWSSAGVSEPAEIDTEGRLRLNCFDPERREQLRTWAEARGFRTNDAIEIN